jgi:Na+-transporting NADH:ubiquinone oxidoreductase subunit C
MPKNLKSLMFAAILCIVCSVLLTAASTGLKPLQQRNMAVDRYKSILKAFGIIDENAAVDAAHIEKIFKQDVQSRWVDGDGRLLTQDQRTPSALPLYIYAKKNTIQAYVVPINTRGLWGEIHGYLAIDNDGTTIRGLRSTSTRKRPDWAAKSKAAGSVKTLKAKS